jgi:ribonucleoside-diphosphate reductase beta chain
MTKALGFSNEFIARDETMHCRFAINLNKELKYKLPESIVHEIFAEAVEIEIEFITEALPCRLIGMNADLMSEYIKYTANYWLIEFGYNPLYPNAENHFDFMILNNIEGKSNFFEKDTSEYRKIRSGNLNELDSF